MEQTGALDHRVFAGKLDKAELGQLERTMVRAVRAPEGDFRDWDQIAEWAMRDRRRPVLQLTPRAQAAQPAARAGTRHTAIVPPSGPARRTSNDPPNASARSAMLRRPLRRPPS